ncbi:Protein of unknown function [Gryllus bimaculatus]|nr:Protein of unknown function [Gryllus bimaculatus]
MRGLVDGRGRWQKGGGGEPVMSESKTMNFYEDDADDVGATRSRADSKGCSQQRRRFGDWDNSFVTDIGAVKKLDFFVNYRRRKTASRQSSAADAVASGAALVSYWSASGGGCGRCPAGPRSAESVFADTAVIRDWGAPHRTQLFFANTAYAVCDSARGLVEELDPVLAAEMTPTTHPSAAKHHMLSWLNQKARRFFSSASLKAFNVVAPSGARYSPTDPRHPPGVSCSKLRRRPRAWPSLPALLPPAPALAAARPASACSAPSQRRPHRAFARRPQPFSPPASLCPAPHFQPPPHKHPRPARKRCRSPRPAPLCPALPHPLRRSLSRPSLAAHAVLYPPHTFQRRSTSFQARCRSLPPCTALPPLPTPPLFISTLNKAPRRHRSPRPARSARPRPRKRPVTWSSRAQQACARLPPPPIARSASPRPAPRLPALPHKSPRPATVRARPASPRLSACFAQTLRTYAAVCRLLALACRPATRAPHVASTPVPASSCSCPNPLALPCPSTAIWDVRQAKPS